MRRLLGVLVGGRVAHEHVALRVGHALTHGPVRLGLPYLSEHGARKDVLPKATKGPPVAAGKGGAAAEGRDHSRAVSDEGNWAVRQGCRQRRGQVFARGRRLRHPAWHGDTGCLDDHAASAYLHRGGARRREPLPRAAESTAISENRPVTRYEVEAPPRQRAAHPARSNATRQQR